MFSGIPSNGKNDQADEGFRQRRVRDHGVNGVSEEEGRDGDEGGAGEKERKGGGSTDVSRSRR